MTDKEILQIAKGVWASGASELNRLQDYAADAQFIKVVRLLGDCTGKIVISGVGTSGVAARKFAHSLSCIEVPALFLNPADAVHGALGVVQPGDVVFLISKGGGTKELVQLLPALRNKKVTSVTITEQKDSPLAKGSDLTLIVRVEREADVFNMLATTSTLAVIALCDAICISVMTLTGYTKEQFAVIHPGGAVGEKLEESLKH